MLEWMEIGQQPTTPGWYWMKRLHYSFEEDAEPYIVKVRWYGERLCVSNWPIPDEGVIWAGPIPTPPPKRIKP